MVGIVNDPVHNRIGQNPITEARIPFRAFVLGAENSRMSIVPVFQNLKQVLLLHFRWQLEKPLVDDEEIVAGKFLYDAGDAPPDFGSIVELFHELRHAEIFDPVQMAASLFPQSTGEVGLSYSGKSVDDQVLMALNVTAAGIAKDFFTAESS